MSIIHVQNINYFYWDRKRRSHDFYREATTNSWCPWGKYL